MGFSNQPQGPLAPVNWSKEVTQDLVWLVDGAQALGGQIPKNIAGGLFDGTVTKSGTIATGYTQNGPGIDFADNAYMRLGNEELFYGKTAFTVMWEGMLDGGSGEYSQNCELVANGDIAADYNWMLRVIKDWDGTNPLKVQFFPKHTGDGGGTGSVLSSVALSRKTHYVIVAVYDGANCYIYINGALSNSATATGSSSRTSSNFGIWLNYGFSYAHQTRVRSAALWNRALKANEISDLGINPLKQLLVQPDFLSRFSAFSAAGGLTTTLDQGDFTFTGGTATGTPFTALTLDSGAFTFTGGDVSGTIPGREALIDAGDFSFTGGDVANTFLTAEISSGNFAFRGGRVSGPSSNTGFFGLLRSIVRPVLRVVNRTPLGGSEASNPSAPAGDAILELLSGMEIGEFVRLDNSSYNLKTGPGGVYPGEATAVAGDLYYNRARFDAGHPDNYTFASDAAVMDWVGGAPTFDTTTMSAIMLYSSVAWDSSRKLICMTAPGGHSNGALTGGLSFDAEAACDAINNDYTDGTGTNVKEKWRAHLDPMPFSAADTTVGEFQHANWGGMSDYLDGSTAGYRWPQPVVNPVLGPANEVGPYGMHTFAALTYHPGTDQIWVSGYTPGNLNHDFSSAPGATWILDCETKAWAKTTTAPGGEVPALIPPPDGDSSVIFYADRSSGTRWSTLLTSSPYTRTTRANQGDGDSLAVESGPFWVKDFVTADKYSLLHISTAGGGKFQVAPDVWPLTTEKAGTLKPSGYSGTRKFGTASGYIYDEVDKLLYAFCDSGTPSYTFTVQIVDMWQGNATVQNTWAISDMTLSGDVPGPATSANFETRTGFENKVIDLGPTYRACLLVTFPGQVHLFKYAEVA